MTSAARHLPPAPARLRRAFTLVEVLIVVTLVAILAALVAPGLANATAPLPQTIASTLEIDMRRASIEAIGRLQPVGLVVSADRTSWWVAEVATPANAIPGTTRILGNGSLGPFTGFTLRIAIDGLDAAAGDAVFCTFNTVGARNGTVVTLQLVGPATESPSQMDEETGIGWTLAAERTRFEIDDE